MAGNRQKFQKHGLSARDIESIFQGPVSVFPDEHSGEEERFIGIGKTEKHLSVFVVLRRKDDVVLIRPIRARFMHKKEIDYYEKETFTLRRKDDVVLIRPISARFMHKKEIDYYEKETSKTEKRRGG